MMVKITELSNQKNKNKFNLFVDGQFYAGILKETAVANNFFVGKEIEQNRLNQILLESETKQAFCKASDYLASRIHTKQELKQKLTKKGFSCAAVKNAINKLEEYGYIDDTQFAKLFAETHQSLSKRMLIDKLISKGILKQTALDIAEYLDVNQIQTATKVAEKYLKGKDVIASREKLYAFLQRRGFDYDTIKHVVKTIYNTDIDFGE